VSLASSAALRAQAPEARFSRGEIERSVAPIALYPDPLLARVLTAATFAGEIPAASAWATQHRHLHGAALAAAMEEARLPWDISVQALLPFQSVLKDMASDAGWTSALGRAFVQEPFAVLDAIQRLRRRALAYDVLRACPALVVRDAATIRIVPADPDYIVTPAYDPLIVFEPPQTGDIDRGRLYCGAGVRLGPPFAAWGWERVHASRSGESGRREF
jgi:hypothetical protein